MELGVTKPSDIDLEAIAWHLGVTVKYRPLTGCEAQIVGADDRAIVIVSDSATPARQRFSIGHELGHWRFDRGRAVDCRVLGDFGSPATSSPHERLANIYAADLLMPRYLLEPWAAEMKVLDVDGISTIAAEFSTSFTATAIRLVNLGVTPGVIVCHGLEGRKWFVLGPDVADGWSVKSELDHNSSAFRVVYGSDRQARPKSVNASVWFNGRSAERFQIREEALKIAKDQTLIILSITDPAMLDPA